LGEVGCRTEEKMSTEDDRRRLNETKRKKDSKGRGVVEGYNAVGEMRGVG